MQNINIKEKGETKDTWTIEVEVEEDGASTKHTVTVNKKDAKRLLRGRKHSAMELVWASFLFLLDRESKESILSEFNLMDIAKYFPEYEKEIKDYL